MGEAALLPEETTSVFVETATRLGETDPDEGANWYSTSGGLSDCCVLKRKRCLYLRSRLGETSNPRIEEYLKKKKKV